MILHDSINQEQIFFRILHESTPYLIFAPAEDRTLLADSLSRCYYTIKYGAGDVKFKECVKDIEDVLSRKMIVDSRTDELFNFLKTSSKSFDERLRNLEKRSSGSIISRKIVAPNQDQRTKKNENPNICVQDNPQKMEIGKKILCILKDNPNSLRSDIVILMKSKFPEVPSEKVAARISSLYNKNHIVKTTTEGKNRYSINS